MKTAFIIVMVIAALINAIKCYGEQSYSGAIAWVLLAINADKILKDLF
jgi:hypothetical protein